MCENVELAFAILPGVKLAFAIMLGIAVRRQPWTLLCDLVHSWSRFAGRKPCRVGSIENANRLTSVVRKALFLFKNHQPDRGIASTTLPTLTYPIIETLSVMHLKRKDTAAIAIRIKLLVIASRVETRS